MKPDNSERWCALCGLSPMPVTVELPDGCLAHPGCADDPSLTDALADHGDKRDVERQAAIARVLDELTPLNPENAMYVAGEILTTLDQFGSTA